MEGIERTLEAADWSSIDRRIREFHSIPRSREEVRDLISTLSAEHPESTESIAALVELPLFCEADRTMERLRDESRQPYLAKEQRERIEREKRESIRELTEFQFLLTHMIISNATDRDHLHAFWNSAEALAKEDHSEGEMDRVKAAVLSQAAIYRLFERIGKRPHLSHPDEDAYYAVDLWTEEHEAIQVKGAPRRESFEVAPAGESVAFPGIALDESGKKRHFNSYISAVQQKMKAKLSKLREIEHRDIEGFVVVIPSDKRDPVTGEPHDDIVEAARMRFGS